jgi:YHS domain-containing protein
MKAFLALSLLVGALLAGCYSEPKNAGTPQSRGFLKEDANSLQADPVCGVTVNPNTSVREHYDGKTYYFHSSDCWRKFHDNPQAYAPGAESPRAREVR